MGWFGLVVVAALMGITLADGTTAGHLAFASGAALFGVVVVVVYLRPAVVLGPEHLLVRNALSDVTVPWHTIDSVHVRHVMEVDTTARTVRALAFGRTTRQQRRRAVAPTGTGSTVPGEVDYTDFVVDRIRAAAEPHRGGADTQVRTSWRWPEVTALAALTVLTVVLALLA
jgi:hypothetical protein